MRGNGGARGRSWKLWNYTFWCLVVCFFLLGFLYWCCLSLLTLVLVCMFVSKLVLISNIVTLHVLCAYIHACIKFKLLPAKLTCV